MVQKSVSAGVFLLALSLISVSGCIASETSPDITISGKIIYNDLEGGFYGISTQDGEHYLLLDLPDEYKTDGLEVRVSGIIDPEVMTIQMWGQPLRIHSIEITGEETSSGTWHEGKKTGITPEQELNMTNVLLHSSTALEQALEMTDTEVGTGAAELKGINLQTKNVTPILENVMNFHPAIYEVTLLDRSGKIIAAYPESFRTSVGKDTSSQSLVSELIKNPLPGMSKCIETVEGNRSINIIYPVFSSSNAVTGYLSVLIQPDIFIKESVSSILKDPSLQILVIEPDGTCIGYVGTSDIGTLSDGSDENKSLGLPSGSPLTSVPAGYDIMSLGSDNGLDDGVFVYWTSVSLHNTPWRVLVISG